MVEAVLVNLEDRGGETGLRKLFHGEANGGGGAGESAIGDGLTHSRPALGRKQLGWGTIVERAGHASSAPWRAGCLRFALNTFGEPKAPFRLAFPSFARKTRKTKPQMNGHLSSGSAAAAYDDAHHARVERVRGSEAVMWKFVVVLLLTAFAILVAQLVSDAPVIQTRVGAANAAQVAYAYAGIRG